MAEEIKNEVENEEETKVKKTAGQKLDAAIAVVTSAPKKVASVFVKGGKKAGLAIGTGLLAAISAGVLLDRKGAFDGMLGPREGNDTEELTDGFDPDILPDVIDVEPEEAKDEEA